MKEPEGRLRVLFVEDEPDDVELMVRELSRAGWDVHHERVASAAEMRRALDAWSWDVVISDHSMPGFSGPAALDVLRESGRDVPFIMVSGTITEEIAVEALRAGAEDFIVKGKLARLVPAVRRELRDAADRRSRRRAEAKLAEHERMLVQAQKMEALGRLAGGVAHDFNNLLTIIRGSAELLRQTLEEDREEIDEIVSAAERGAELTRQLMSFSRGDSGETRTVSVLDLLRDVENMIRRLLPKTVRLDLRLEAPHAAVQVDVGRIEQALLNLVVNAGDAMPEGGILGIATGNPDPDTVEIVVWDTGTGMTPEVRDRVFEPFFTTKEEGKGTGLGLATAYSAIEKSGGSIRVDSKPGEGTTFTIRLAVARESSESD